MIESNKMLVRVTTSENETFWLIVDDFEDAARQAEIATRKFFEGAVAELHSPKGELIAVAAETLHIETAVKREDLITALKNCVSVLAAASPHTAVLGSHREIDCAWCKQYRGVLDTARLYLAREEST